MEIIKLNLIPSGVNPTCHAKQYDKGRIIRFELFNGLTPYTLQSGDTVTLNLRKLDNTIIEASVTATQGNKYVDLVTTEQMCAVVGYNLGCFKIVNGEDDIGTLNFIMAVERDVLADGVPSQSVIEDLDALVAEAVGDDYYTKNEVDAKLDLKADTSSVNSALSHKANTSDVNEALALKADKTEVNAEIDSLEKGKSILVEKGYFTDAQKALDQTIGYDTAKYYSDKNILVGTDIRTSSGTTNIGINFRDFGLNDTNAIIDINDYPYLCYMLESDVPSNVNINLTIWFYTSSMSQYTETITLTTRDQLVFFNLKEYAETSHLDRYYKYAFVVACTSSSYTFTSAYLRFSMFGFFTKDQANNYNLKEKITNLAIGVSDIQDTLTNELIKPQKTSFFEGANYFDIKNTKLITGIYVASNGKLAVLNSIGNTLIMSVKPNTDYYMYIPSNNAGRIAESENEFIIGDTYNLIYSDGQTTGAYHFTTGANTHFVAVYFYSGEYDYNANKNSIVLNVGKYYNGQIPFIPYDYLPQDISNVLKDTQILIFGDSITDCCRITIDANDRTSEYYWRDPSLSYVDALGNTVNLSKWAKILNESQPVVEIRNYALSGASYRTEARTEGNERQNAQYQIDVALNDVDNPNDVFAVEHFNPDIIIFALGTNDTPNDTFASAMAKTVLKSDNASIDVAATLANLDDTKFCESMRKAFMRIEQAFPTAQRFCVIPIQRAIQEADETKNLYIRQMAERYGCIIINGFAESGITRDFNNKSALGLLLIDGLHPNEKGQNMMARMIISSLKSHFIPFGNGFNS